MKVCGNCQRPTRIKRAYSTGLLVILSILSLIGIVMLWTGLWPIAILLVLGAPVYYVSRNHYCQNCSGTDIVETGDLKKEFWVEPANAPDDGITTGKSPTKAWYVLPVLLAIIGGLAMLFALSRDDLNMAKKGLLVGVLVTFLWVIVFASMDFFPDGEEYVDGIGSVLTPSFNTMISNGDYYTNKTIKYEGKVYAVGDTTLVFFEDVLNHDQVIVNHWGSTDVKRGDTVTVYGKVTKIISVPTTFAMRNIITIDSEQIEIH